jgi:F0F1-type ATP synthase assembly protein I
MADTDRFVPGNDAHTGSAGAPAGVPSAHAASRSARLARKVVLISTAGTSVSPLQREGYAKATNAGYSTAMGRGLELALTLLICCGIGLALDALFDTAPIFTILLSVVGFAGVGVKLKLGYDLEMDAHERGAIWNRGKAA